MYVELWTNTECSKRASLGPPGFIRPSNFSLGICLHKEMYMADCMVAL